MGELAVGEKNLSLRVERISEEDLGIATSLLTSEDRVRRSEGYFQVKSLLTDRLGLDGEEFLESWGKTAEAKNRPGIIAANLRAIVELEGQREGICRTLYEEFGIRNFSRYPDSILINQYDTKDQSLPYGVAIFPYSDWNSAFSRAGYDIETIPEDLEGKYALRVLEVGGKYSLAKRMLQLNQRYDSKISFAIFGAHGTEEGVSLGGMKKSQNIHIKDISGQGFEISGSLLRKVLDKDPSIAIVACSAGERLGFVEKLQRTVDSIGAHVVGANDKATMVPIKAALEDGKPKLLMDFDKSDKKMEYSSGRIYDSRRVEKEPENNVGIEVNIYDYYATSFNLESFTHLIPNIRKAIEKSEGRIVYFVENNGTEPMVQFLDQIVKEKGWLWFSVQESLAQQLERLPTGQEVDRRIEEIKSCKGDIDQILERGLLNMDELFSYFITENILDDISKKDRVQVVMETVDEIEYEAFQRYERELLWLQTQGSESWEKGQFDTVMATRARYYKVLAKSVALRGKSLARNIGGVINQFKTQKIKGNIFAPLEAKYRPYIDSYLDKAGEGITSNVAAFKSTLDPEEEALTLLRENENAVLAPELLARGVLLEELIIFAFEYFKDRHKLNELAHNYESIRSGLIREVGKLSFDEMREMCEDLPKFLPRYNRILGSIIGIYFR